MRAKRHQHFVYDARQYAATAAKVDERRRRYEYANTAVSRSMAARYILAAAFSSTACRRRRQQIELRYSNVRSI